MRLSARDLPSLESAFSCDSSNVQQSFSDAKKYNLFETWSSSWFVIWRRAFGVGWYEKRWFWLYLKMKFNQIVCQYRSVHQNFSNAASNAAYRFQLASISFLSSVFSSVVQTIFGSALRHLWSRNVSMVTKLSPSKHILPVHTKSKFQVHLGYTYKL